MPGGDFDDTMYQILVDRCRSLEESHSKLREQFEELVQEEKMVDELAISTDSDMGYFPGFCFSVSPFKSILDSIGHAVHISKASSGEIIYWNLSATKLFGWKDYEIVGETVATILISEEYLAPFNKIIQRLTAGQPWSGQFPFKKRSGEIFMAMVTKSLLYEDGELLGVIMVSSDAALFNSINPYHAELDQDLANDEHRRRGFNFKRIPWQTRPPIVPVPQIASSASHLASKFLPRRHKNDTHNGYAQPRDSATDAADIKEKHTISEPEISCSSNHKKSTIREDSDMDGSTSPISQPSKIAAKMLAKLQIGGTATSEKGYKNGRRNGSCNEENSEDRSKQENHGSPDARISHHNNDFRDVIEENADANNLCLANITAKISGNRTSHAYERNSSISSLKECNDYGDSANARNQLSKAGLLHDPKFDLEASNLEVGDEPRKQNTSLFAGSGDSSASLGSSSNKGDNDSNSVAECGIHWENLLLREEIGQGSYAVVYRGLWNGSDVAVKVYFGNEYSEGTLQDYEKEINIMKRLRHPNVLLFMGAVCSHERLAIVTEFLPRGSLFKTLHKNNQTIDIRRRLNMALDVARGMNYLHHRNPPIVHRDLKSSNLLVDRNWNVKVGDFGLSRLKDATFLTSKSGRGTPQWMAPEVLRNEPSNEKSDVFSFGVILWELMTQSIPWSNLNSLQVVGVVGFMDRRLELPERVDPQIKSLIFDCWNSDPEQRPSFQEILPRMTSLINRVAAVSIRRISHS